MVQRGFVTGTNEFPIPQDRQRARPLKRCGVGARLQHPRQLAPRGAGIAEADVDRRQLAERNQQPAVILPERFALDVQNGFILLPRQQPHSRLIVVGGQVVAVRNRARVVLPEPAQGHVQAFALEILRFQRIPELQVRAGRFVQQRHLLQVEQAVVAVADSPGGLKHRDGFQRLIVQDVDSGELGVGLDERRRVRPEFRGELADAFQVARLGVLQLGALQLQPALFDRCPGFVFIGRERRAHCRGGEENAEAPAWHHGPAWRPGGRAADVCESEISPAPFPGFID